MNIMYCCDSRIAQYITVSLASVCVHHPDDAITFYIFHKDNFDDALPQIRKTADKFHAAVVDVVMPNEPFGIFSFGSGEWRDHWPAETYYYFLAHQFLPDDMERILYIDVDVLARNDLHEMYDVDFEGKLFAGACHDTPEHLAVKIEKIRKYKIVGLYDDVVNSGVLMLNLKEFRAKRVDAKTYKDFIDLLVRLHGRENIFMDQALLNAMFVDQIKYLDKKYNDNGPINDDSKIIHAAGHIAKPWVVQMHPGFNYRIFTKNHVGQDWVDTSIRFNIRWWEYAKLASNYDELYAKAVENKEKTIAAFEECKKKYTRWLEKSLSETYRRSAVAVQV